MIHVCTVCGYQYNDDVEMTPFDLLPDDWCCPICDAPKSTFTTMSYEDLNPDDA